MTEQLMNATKVSNKSNDGREVKEPKYTFKGKGFNSKRQLHLGMAMHYLSNSGIEKLQKVLNEANQKLCDLYPEDGEEKNLKKLHVGFRNSQQSTIKHDLEEIMNDLTGKGRVDLVAYIFGAGGQVYQQASELLLRYDFNEEGINIVNEKLDTVAPLTEGYDTTSGEMVSIQAGEGKSRYGADNVKSTISTNPLE